MAAVYKCTKLTNLGKDLLVTGEYTIRADFYDPTIPSPPLRNVSAQVPGEEITDHIAIQEALDAVLSLLGTDTINWAI